MRYDISIMFSDQTRVDFKDVIFNFNDHMVSIVIPEEPGQIIYIPNSAFYMLTTNPHMEEEDAAI